MEIEEAKKLLLDNGFTIRTKDEETSLFTNFEKEKTERYVAGQETKAKRMVNDLCEKTGISLENKAKTEENFVEAFKSKIITEEKLPVDKRIKDLETDNEKLQQNLQASEAGNEAIKQEIIKKQQAQTVRDRLFKGIPEKAELILPASRIVSLAEKEVEFKFDGENIFIIKDGNILKDSKTLQPITPEIFASDYIKDFAKQVIGGNAGTDKIPNQIGTWASFEKEMGEKGIQRGSEKFNREMIERQKAGTLKIE